MTKRFLMRSSQMYIMINKKQVSSTSNPVLSPTLIGDNYYRQFIPYNLNSEQQAKQQMQYQIEEQKKFTQKDYDRVKKEGEIEEEKSVRRQAAKMKNSKEMRL